MARKRSFSDKFWHDKQGHFVVWQKPNIPLWIWIAATLLSIIIGNNAFTRAIGFVGGLAIIVWAVLEVGWGANYFRRLLGFCVLLLIAVTHFIGGF